MAKKVFFALAENTYSIGAGSVVTRSIPANVFACGSPCKIVRELLSDDTENIPYESNE